MEPSEGGSTRTLARGLAVLTALLEAEQPPTLTQLAVATGLAKPTVSRLLGTLVEAGFASQQPGSQSYLAGPSIARWLRTSPLEALLVEQAAPLLRELRDLSGETAVLCVPAWPDRVCVLRSLSPAPVRADKAVGECAPLTRGCTGRAFLAFGPEELVDRALEARPLVRTTPTSVAGVTELRDLLRAERERGWSMSVEGTFAHMNGLAAPVLPGLAPAPRLPVAVVNVSGPSNRWTPEAMERFAPELVSRAAALGATLAPAGTEIFA